MILQALKEYYDRKQYWPAESLARWEALRPKIARYRDELRARRD